MRSDVRGEAAASGVGAVSADVVVNDMEPPCGGEAGRSGHSENRLRGAADRAGRPPNRSEANLQVKL
ncbi:hypothetical protein GCM10027064_12780 [Microbacterium petrolearium]